MLFPTKATPDRLRRYTGWV